MAALKASGRPWTLKKGEGAFYGPKLEYVLRDAVGRGGWGARSRR
jgi:threonyl-tRNA synthetase